MKVDGKKAYTLYKIMRYAKYAIPIAVAVIALSASVQPTSGDPKDDPFTF